MSADQGERVLISEDAITSRIPELAKAILASPKKPDFAVPVLAGAFVFAADLLRALARLGVDLPTEFIWLRAYGNAQFPGEVAVLRAPSSIVDGRTVLLIDGVLDSGVTLMRAKQLLEEAGAAAVVSVVVVAKANPSAAFVADYVGFTAGPEFLYGYGLDRSGASRGLPDIRVR